MNTAGDKSRGCKGRQSHVKGLSERRWIHHRRQWIDINGPAINDVETRGSVHPRICYHDENARECAAYSDHRAGEQMCSRRHAMPTIEIDAQKDRFGKECESFERK